MNAARKFAYLFDVAINGYPFFWQYWIHLFAILLYFAFVLLLVQRAIRDTADGVNLSCFGPASGKVRQAEPVSVTMDESSPCPVREGFDFVWQADPSMPFSSTEGTMTVSAILVLS